MNERIKALHKPGSNTNKVGRPRKNISQQAHYVFDRQRKSLEDWLDAYIRADYETLNHRGTLIPRKRNLIDVYEHAMLDAHLSALSENRLNRVNNVGFKIVDSEGESDKDAKDLLERDWFKDYMELVLEADLFGYSLIELGELTDTGEVSDVELVQRRNTIPEFGIVLRQPYDNDGIDFTQRFYRDRYVLVHRGHGKLLKATPIALYKRYGLGSWVQASEVFAYPFIHVKTMSDDEQEKNRIAEDIKNGATERIAVTEFEDEIEIHNMNSTDAHEIFDKLIERCNQEMSKLILGATLLTDSGGSEAQSRVHESTVANNTRADLTTLENNINNELLPRLAKLSPEVYGVFSNKKFRFSSAQITNFEDKRAAYDLLLRYFEIDEKTVEDDLGITVEKAREHGLFQGSGKSGNGSAIDEGGNGDNGDDNGTNTDE